METIERPTTEPTGPKRNRGWLLAAAVAALVVLIGAIVIGLRGDSGTDVVEPTPTTPTTLPTPTTAAPPTTLAAEPLGAEAQALVDALAAGHNSPDAVNFTALLAPDVEFLLAGASLEPIDLNYRVNAALNGDLQFDGCLQRGDVIECTALRTDDIFEQVNPGSRWTSQVLLTFDGSVLTRWEDDLGGIEPYTQAVNDFRRWYQETQPDSPPLRAPFQPPSWVPTIDAPGYDEAELPETVAALVASWRAPAQASPTTADPLFGSCGRFDGAGLEAMATLPIPAALGQQSSLETMAQMVQTSGLAETLGDEGPYTFFAITDSGWGEVPLPDAVDYFTSSPFAARLMTEFHTIPGEALTMAALLDLGGFDVLTGEERTFVELARRYRLGPIPEDGDSAFKSYVICGNIPVGNGIVHIIEDEPGYPDGAFDAFTG